MMDDQIYNPATKRYVRKDGKVGRKLLKDLLKTSDEIPGPAPAADVNKLEIELKEARAIIENLKQELGMRIIVPTHIPVQFPSATYSPDPTPFSPQDY